MQEKTDIYDFSVRTCPLSHWEISSGEIYEDHVITDLTDILPGNKERVFPAKGLQYRLVSGSDDPEHSAVTSDREINDPAEAFPIYDVHDLLLSQFAKSQLIHIESYYRRFNDMTNTAAHKVPPNYCDTRSARSLLIAAFSSLDTCACDIPSAALTSICVRPL